MLDSFTKGPGAFKNLRIFNLIMGFLHLVQALAMLVLSTDTEVKLTTSFLSSKIVGNKFIAETDLQEFTEISLGPAVAVFLLLSAIAHFLLASETFNDWYNSNLKQGINYARWYEYALSSSVMIVIIAILCGMYDVPSLILIFSLNACMNLFGLLMEMQNLGKERISWVPYVFGIFAGIVPWIIITWYFVSAVTGFEGENPVPEFVYGILISIFIFFNIFAINMYLQYKKVGPWQNYLFGEAVYIILSLVAKSALAWQVFSGTLR